MSDKNSEKIKRLHADAEVQWGEYENSVCHEIQRIIEHDGIYNSHNFYEFCKGYVFARLDADEKLQAAEEENKILREAVANMVKQSEEDCVLRGCKCVRDIGFIALEKIKRGGE